MQIYDFKVIYNELNEKLDIIKSKFGDIDGELAEIEKKQGDQSLWNDIQQVATLSKNRRALERKKENLEFAEGLLSDFYAVVELIEEGSMEYDEKELLLAKKQAEKALDGLWIESLLSKEYDGNSAIISLHAGAGGEEAQDWAEMLSRMYVRYADSQGYSVTLLDKTAGDGAGIKAITYLIDGKNAYGYLKTEKGVHRLVRLSPFDANNRRHTSFASLEVSPFVEDSKSDIQINPNDLRIDTYRSSGAGGQHVNKTESAIRITHLPTGIVVQCQNERSQIQNREMAMKMLISKLTERDLAKKEEEKQKLLGENKKIEWGSQIRSYVLHPYNLVKDHRTGVETSDTDGVLAGDIQPFINECLRREE